MQIEVMSTLAMLTMLISMSLSMSWLLRYLVNNGAHRKASTVGTEITKKGGRQKNLEPQTSGESVYL
jgi:hypothetical protein